MAKRNSGGMHRKRLYNTLAIVLLSGILLYHSVDIEKLSERQNQSVDVFDTKTYVDTFWLDLQNKRDVVEAEILLPLLAADLEQAIAQYGKTLGVSSTHSFLCRGNGIVSQINDDSFTLAVRASGMFSLIVQTDFIFGNAVRDASGLVRVSDFPSTMEFNAISSEINKHVVQSVLPPVMNTLTLGDSVLFVVAFSVNENNPDINPLLVVPVKLEIIKS